MKRRLFIALAIIAGWLAELLLLSFSFIDRHLDDIDREEWQQWRP